MSRERLRRVLTAYEPQPYGDDTRGLWPAGVLVLIYDHGGRPHIVFQKRTDKVDAHKGQISFPGGGQDPGDADILATALRETHEEIGVHPQHVDVLGQLDQMKTISNFLVTPYVGWLAHYPYTWTFSDDEVAYLLEVPIDHLLHPDTLVPDVRVINGQEIVLPSYRFGDDLIWGATARMLTNFLDLWGAIEG